MIVVKRSVQLAGSVIVVSAEYGSNPELPSDRVHPQEPRYYVDGIRIHEKDLPPLLALLGISGGVLR
jgi:hypothetical protein